MSLLEFMQIVSVAWSTAVATGRSQPWAVGVLDRHPEFQCALHVDALSTVTVPSS